FSIGLKQIHFSSGHFNAFITLSKFISLLINLSIMQSKNAASREFKYIIFISTRVIFFQCNRQMSIGITTSGWVPKMPSEKRQQCGREHAWIYKRKHEFLKGSLPFYPMWFNSPPMVFEGC